MLGRAARLVAAAEAVRRTGKVLQADPLVDLLESVRRELGIGRRIRMVVTERLTSPAVVGVLVPTLILPLSLVTTLPLDQLSLILIHEIAHIRRGDYVANLVQLLA